MSYSFQVAADNAKKLAHLAEVEFGKVIQQQPEHMEDVPHARYTVGCFISSLQGKANEGAQYVLRVNGALAWFAPEPGAVQPMGMNFNVSLHQEPIAA